LLMHVTKLDYKAFKHVYNGVQTRFKQCEGCGEVIRCIEVETLSRVYASASAGGKRLGIALIGLDPPTLVVLGKGFYICRDVKSLRELVERVFNGCINVVYLVKRIDEDWLERHLPMARRGDVIIGDGVIATLRVEQKRFSLRKACIEKEAVVYILEEVLRKQSAEALLQILRSRQVKTPA